MGASLPRDPAKALTPATGAAPGAHLEPVEPLKPPIPRPQSLWEYVEACAADGDADAALAAADGGGVARVAEALHAHMWPGLTLKRGGRGGSAGGGEGASAVGAVEVASDAATLPPLPGEDPSEIGVESFESLLASLGDARARLMGLGDDERRAAAADLAERMMAAVGLGCSDSEGSEDEAQGKGGL